MTAVFLLASMLLMTAMVNDFCRLRALQNLQILEARLEKQRQAIACLKQRIEAGEITDSMVILHVEADREIVLTVLLDASGKRIDSYTEQCRDP